MSTFQLALFVVLAAAAIAVKGILLSGDAVPDPMGTATPTEVGAYWRLPLAPQGEAPAHWSEIETSLAPEACGQCHADKLAEWRQSLHAAAFSPGLAGQLVSLEPQETRLCMQCHAPLAEQHTAFEAAMDDPDVATIRGLQASGIVCAACHMRERRVFAPPKRKTEEAKAGTDSPHGGATRVGWFHDSSFCLACHQSPAETAVNGKPLMNTYAEWQASAYAREGTQCQDCHMPGRAHLWRGIHDPEMVKSGLTAKADSELEGARFTITNTGVGHAFPTYVTAKAVIQGIVLDEKVEPRPETAVLHTIQREVDVTEEGWVERSDSRLLPGQLAVLFVPWREGTRVRVWVDIYPDDFYDRKVFGPMLGSLPSDSAAARQISAAAAKARTSRYHLFETTILRK